jgi:hypothetical protein
MPQQLRRPGSPSSRHLPRFQTDEAPAYVAKGVPSKLGLFSGICESSDRGIVMAITEMSG